MALSNTDVSWVQIFVTAVSLTISMDLQIRIPAADVR